MPINKKNRFTAYGYYAFIFSAVICPGFFAFSIAVLNILFPNPQGASAAGMMFAIVGMPAIFGALILSALVGMVFTIMARSYGLVIITLCLLFFGFHCWYSDGIMLLQSYPEVIFSIDAAIVLAFYIHWRLIRLARKI